jgi:hypothetical protein
MAAKLAAALAPRLLGSSRGAVSDVLSTTNAMTSRITRSLLLWLAAYAVTMALAVWLLWSARASVLAQLDDPEQRAQWQEWKEREESRALEKTSPVERRPPASNEPPTLVLMRDHFAAAVATCIAAGTVLFAFFAFVIVGVMSGRAASSLAQPSPAQPAEENGQEPPLFARHAGE